MVRPTTSTAPAIVTKIVQARLAGKSKNQIRKDLHMSPNTVRKIIEESNIDKLVADQRLEAFKVAPDAIKTVHNAIRKGDNRSADHAFRLLEGLNILGPDVQPANVANNTLNVAIGSLLAPTKSHNETALQNAALAPIDGTIIESQCDGTPIAPPHVDDHPAPVPDNAQRDPNPSSRETGGGSNAR